MKIVVADKNRVVNKEFLDLENPDKIINSCRGKDHIDYTECKKRGIPIKEIEYNPEDSVADHAIASWLYLVTIAPKIVGEPGEETMGKNALIIGAGDIGQAIHSRLYGFGVKTKYYDPYKTELDINQFDLFRETCFIEDLKNGLEWCDYCFVACPLTNETIGLLGFPEFMKLKGKVLVNTARNEIADPYYLSMAMDWGLRVAWDFNDELNKASWIAWDRLLTAQNHGQAILTKHNAWFTKEAKQRREKAIEKAIK